MTFRTIRKVENLKHDDGDGLIVSHTPDSETGFVIRLEQCGRGVSLTVPQLQALLHWLNAVGRAEDDNAADAMLKGNPNA